MLQHTHLGLNSRRKETVWGMMGRERIRNKRRGKWEATIVAWRIPRVSKMHWKKDEVQNWLPRLLSAAVYFSTINCHIPGNISSILCFIIATSYCGILYTLVHYLTKHPQAHIDYTAINTEIIEWMLSRHSCPFVNLAQKRRKFVFGRFLCCNNASRQ